MKFQIFSNEINEPVSLIEFDKMFCHELGIEVHPKRYASWYGLTESILLNHGAIADNMNDCTFKEHFVSERRTISFLEAARCLLISPSRWLFSGEKIESVKESMNAISPYITFLLNHQTEYHFQYSF